MSSYTNQTASQWKPTDKVESQPKRINFTEQNSNPETGVSLCVPFAFKNVSSKKVFSIFKKPTVILDSIRTEVNLGLIDRIDIKFRKDGNKCVFIHFAPGKWNDNETTKNFLNLMKNGTPLRVSTDNNGHFWKTIISKSERPCDYIAENAEQVEQAEEKQAVEEPADPVEEKHGEEYDVYGQSVEQDDCFA
tara:strand:- start:1 stop:573 length:573 start_codon:yes stop_codon:yes gene_type:complete